VPKGCAALCVVGCVRCVGRPRVVLPRGVWPRRLARVVPQQEPLGLRGRGRVGAQGVRCLCVVGDAVLSWADPRVGSHLPEMFQNINGLNLGSTQAGEKIGARRFHKTRSLGHSLKPVSKN